MSTLARAVRLASLLPRRPREFVDRVTGLWEVQADRSHDNYQYPLQSFDDALRRLSDVFATDAAALLDESAFHEIEEHVRRTASGLSGQSSIPSIHNADVILAKLVYVVCRLLRPRNVVETGVAHGMSSAFILRAMKENGVGKLWSIDLPPLRRSAMDYVGLLVPDELRQNWVLNIGSSRRLLPKVLKQVGSVDLFLHDSMHTYRTMRFEFDTVWPHLSRTAILMADDIEGNAAFADFTAEHPPNPCLHIPEAKKQGICGIGVYRSPDAT